MLSPKLKRLPQQLQLPLSPQLRKTKNPIQLLHLTHQGKLGADGTPPLTLPSSSSNNNNNSSSIILGDGVDLLSGVDHKGAVVVPEVPTSPDPRQASPHQGWAAQAQEEWAVQVQEWVVPTLQCPTTKP